MQAQKRYDVLGQTSYAGIARIRFKATRNCGLFRSQPRMPLSAPVFMSKPIIHVHRGLSSLSNFIHTIPPPGFTRFLQCSFICTGYTVAVLTKHPDRSDRHEEKEYTLRGHLPPRGKVAPQGRMRGKLPIANRKRAAIASSALISHLTVTASPSGEAKKRAPNRVPAFLSVKIYLLILIRSAPGSTVPEATTSTSLKSSVFVTTVITTAG